MAGRRVLAGASRSEYGGMQKPNPPVLHSQPRSRKCPLCTQFSRTVFRRPGQPLGLSGRFRCCAQCWGHPQLHLLLVLSW